MATKPLEKSNRLGGRKRRWIGTMDMANLLGCHPMTLPRLIKTKPGFPKPVKPFGKNLWDADEAEAYLDSLVKNRT